MKKFVTILLATVVLLAGFTFAETKGKIAVVISTLNNQSMVCCSC
ncbi:MAG: ribose transport system substrate-binding protein [Pseudothermotoga sp.]|jgi:hypothetical protein|nr:hypothetical protein [Pseudothermotoga lettingae]MDI3494145.1 ribose transport system substrate-binding protein [Pseudothermotoga sp.]